MKKSIMIQSVMLLGVWFLSASVAFAYCETLEEPLVRDARKALDQQKVEIAFKWVKKDREPEVAEAFDRAVKERKANPTTREATDKIFFESLGRVHCEGENFPFLGKNPAGSKVHPVRQAIDRSLSTDGVDDLTNMINAEVSKGIHDRFDKVRQFEPGEEDNVDIARQYVDSYVDYVDYVEKVHRDATEGRNTRKNG